MLALFHDKNIVFALICSLYFVRFYYIVFGIKLVKNRAWNENQYNFVTSLWEVREKSNLWKKAREKHMLEAKESSVSCILRVLRKTSHLARYPRNTLPGGF